jgi:hypothetical protein
MTKETRLIVRLIALWILFIASLWFLFWSIQNFTMSVVKTNTGGYQQYYTSYGAGSYGGGGYCLQMPSYPSLSSSMMMGAAPSKDDEAKMDKYNQDLQKYNNDWVVACKEDLAKQEKSKEAQEASNSSTDIVVYSVLSLASLFAASLSLLAIRQTEKL